MRASVRASKPRRWGRAACPPLIALFAALLLAVPVRAEIRRVVSLNPCLDTILVNVADRGQIAALSHYARDAHSSAIAEIAATLPIVHEAAEDVIMLQPDLVLAGFHNSPATRNALKRLGIREETFRVPETVADSIAQCARPMAACIAWKCCFN